MSDRLPGAAIIETVTTTINPDGTVNCAAMGVEWRDEVIVIKPFPSTRTLRNLEATGAAVVNLTDDILLFTQAALGDPHPPTLPTATVAGAVLADACSWREVRVDGDRRQRAARTCDDAGGGRAGTGASSLASTAPATPSSRHRSSPRAHAGCPLRRSEPSWIASRCSSTRRRGRGSTRR